MLRERSPGLANASRSNPMAEPRFVEAIGVLRLGLKSSLRMTSLKVVGRDDTWGTMHDISWANRQTLQNATWDDVQRRVGSPVRTALDKVLLSLDGSSLTRGECLPLANSTGDDLFGLV